MSRKLPCFLGMIFLSITSLSWGSMSLLPVSIDISDKAALQRGAKLFVNYCSGCHSLRYMRYNRLALDLGLLTNKGVIDINLLTKNLVFTSAGSYSPINIAMPDADAKQWFGTLPPDLSLVARQRGVSWIYTYLKSFYQDASRPFGSNNLLFQEVAMPNILAPLRGKVILNPHGSATLTSLELVEKGQMTPLQFDRAVVDLVTFLDYVGEPGQLERKHLGKGVLLFLFILFFMIYALNRSYWRSLKK